MNKTKISNRSITTNRPQKMRIVFKNRNNHREQFTTNIFQSKKTTIDNLSDIQFEDETKDKIKQYIKNRMKTQHTENINQKNKKLIHFNLEDKTQRSKTKMQVHNNQQLTKSSPINFISQKKQQSKKIQSLQKSNKKINIQNLQQMEKIIDNNIINRLNQCYGYKNLQDWKNEQNINQILINLKSIKNQNPQTQELIDKKINLLERLMAQKIVQSDLLKKRYLQKYNKNSSKKLHKFLNLSLNQTYKKNQIEQHKKDNFIKNSTNQQSFTSPQKSAYNIYKHQKSYFNADRHKQPLPRSSYNRQFLQYGCLPSFYASKPNDNDCFKSVLSQKSINSSYRDSFVSKKAEKINIKELDAYKDKIKNLPIVFSKHQKQIICKKLTDYVKQKKKQIHQVRKRETKSPIMVKYLSQSKRQFIKTDSFVPSKIKHENLHKLKYSFKKDLHI